MERKHPRSAPRRSLLLRLFAINAAVMTVTALVLPLTPIAIGWPPSGAELALVLSGLALALAIDLLLLQGALQPLGRLRAAMLSVDPRHRGPRIDVGARSVDVADLAAGFNDMLDRLESERRLAAQRTQAAQEAERRWLALELHDQIGQNLTALLLQLDVASRAVPESALSPLAAARATARETLDRIRELSANLRPDILEDLGLANALVHLCTRIEMTTGLDVRPDIAADLPGLSPDTQLVVYRITQESLTNIVRHADATSAQIRLIRREDGLSLVISDDGRGGDVRPGSGVAGMHERALMVGSRLSFAPSSTGGLEVRLDVPLSGTSS